MHTCRRERKDEIDPSTIPAAGAAPLTRPRRYPV